MQFVNPNILYALLALIIPILVHLFQLRKFQKTPFTNVKFLQELVVQTRKSSQLKKWLILLTRLAVFSCIILAFAQPYFTKHKEATEEKETVIYLDNSLSMQAKGEKGELLKVAVQELIENFSSKQKVHVLTNSGSFPNTTLENIKNELIQLEYSANQLAYKTVSLKANQLFNKENNTHKQLILISDFQNNSEIDSSFLNQSISNSLVKLSPVKKENISIDTAFIEKGNLKVIIKNQQSNSNNIPVSLFENNKLISKVSASLEKSRNIISFPLGNNNNTNYMLGIETDDLAFDNRLYLNRNLPNKINVLSIGDQENNIFLSKIFTKGEFKYTENKSDAINYSIFNKQHLIVLNELNDVSAALLQNIQTFEKNGGSVLFIPSINENNKTINFLNLFGSLNSFSTRLTQLNYSHPILSDVFEKEVKNFQYPQFQKHYSLKNYQSTILSFENQEPLLVQKDNFYVFAASLNKENSNIKQAPIIVPTLYNIAKNSLKENKLYYSLAIENTIDIPVSLNKDQVLSITNVQSESFIPLQKITKNKVQLYTNEQPSKAGNYSLTHNEKNLSAIAYNYNRSESDLNYHELTSIENNSINSYTSLEDAISEINSRNEVRTLWKWFVIFALIFLGIELLILKYFK